VAGFFMRDRMAGMNSRTSWLDRIGYLGLLGLYVAVLIASPIIGAVLFFFPILQICELMGWEPSNLGPIATFIWGILFDVFVATPGFIILAIVKLVRQKSQPN
jgi:hypothetical protein